MKMANSKPLIVLGPTITSDVEEHLQSLLMKEQVRDLPVAVICIAGEQRMGKSCLMNFLLKFFTKTCSDRLSCDRNSSLKTTSVGCESNWMDSGSAILGGFEWKGGVDACTYGICMWPEVFVMDCGEREKLAIVLMDSEGTLDISSSMRESANVFGISLALSSIQIYNVMKHVNLKDVEDLLTFSECARYLVDNENCHLFQNVTFVVRDWSSPESYSYGCSGGLEYLRGKILPGKSGKIGKRLSEYFQRVNCCLFPHPGEKIANGKTDGQISDFPEEFKLCVNEFLEDITSKCKEGKRILDEPVLCKDLFATIKYIRSCYDSGELLEIRSIHEEFRLKKVLQLQERARDIYVEKFRNSVKENSQTVLGISWTTKENLEAFDEEFRQAALSFLHEKVARLKYVDVDVENLNRLLSDSFDLFCKENEESERRYVSVKRLTDLSVGKYDEKINRLIERNCESVDGIQWTGDDTLHECHLKASASAKRHYIEDAMRLNILDSYTNETTRELNSRFVHFQIRNNQNRNTGKFIQKLRQITAAAVDLYEQTFISSKTRIERNTWVKEGQLEEYHNTARGLAFDHFRKEAGKSARCYSQQNDIANEHIHRISEELNKSIQESFRKFRAGNDAQCGKFIVGLIVKISLIWLGFGQIAKLL